MLPCLIRFSHPAQDYFQNKRAWTRTISSRLKKAVGRFEGAFSSIALERARFPRRFSLVFQGRVPFSGLLAPLVQGKIVRNPEQRSTDRHLVSVAWRVNNHYTGRYQAGAGRVMRLRPSPHNGPMGADQR